MAEQTQTQTHPLAYLPLVGLWFFSSDRYRQLEGGVMYEEDETAAPVWVQEFDSLSYDFFGRGYSMLLERYGVEADAESVLIEIDSSVINLVTAALDRMTPRPPFYLLLAHILKHLVLQRLPQWWNVNPTLHGSKGRFLALAQRIVTSISAIKMDEESRTALQDVAIQIGETWVKAIQHISDRLTGKLYDLTPLLMDAAQKPIAIWETRRFAERFAEVLGARVNWDREAGKEWIDLHSAQVFCRIRVNFRFMFVTPAIPQPALAFAQSNGFLVLTVQDFDAPVFMLSPHYDHSLYGMGHLHLLLDTRAFSVSDLWFATL